MVTVFLGNFMASLDGTIVNVSLPTMLADLGGSLPTIAWVVIAYRLASAGSILSFGRLSDLAGSRPIYAYGFLIFTVGSALAGLFSRSAEELIAYRVLQGLGGAMMLSNSFAIVTASFPSHERGKVIGLIVTSWTLGSSLGPALGGFLVSLLGWRSIFTVNLPVGVVGFVMAQHFLPAGVRSGRRLDYVGAVTFALALTPLLVALREVGQGRLWAGGPLLVASGGAFLFLYMYERRLQDPLLDLRLLGQRFVRVSVVARLGMVASLAVVDLMMPFYLVGVLGYSPLHLGFLLTSLPLSFALAGALGGWASDRVGVLPPVLVGSALMAAAQLLLSVGVRGGEAVLTPLLGLVGFGVAGGLFFAPNSSGILGVTPADRRGFASSLLPMLWNVGYSLGSALASVVFTLSVPATSAGLGEVLKAGAASSGSLLAPGIQSTLVLGGVMALVALLVYAVRRRDAPKADRGGTAGSAT